MAGKLRHIERTILLETHGKKLWVLRNKPAHAAHLLSGIKLPPHERYWLGNYFLSYQDNITIGSRGTSKTFCHCSLAAELDTLLHRGLDTLVVSASGFRGGKLIFEDAKRMIQGELRSQNIPGPFMIKSAESNKVIRQEPDRWIIKWSSFSSVMTVPTNNSEAMRGIRARKATIDEFNFFDYETTQVILGPMMNVGGEFEKIAKADQGNAVYKTTTIDYTFRPAWKEIDTMRRTAKRQHDVMQALLVDGDHDTYERGITENKNELVNLSIQYSRFDYTDLLIPVEIEDDEGEVWDVNYPLASHLVREDLLKWDDRDVKYYWYTYPVSKSTLEEPLLNGNMDEDLWLAENRNVFIEASGSVYTDALVKKSSETPIYFPGDTEGYTGDEEFFPPVMMTCGDPCVVGVDYAREKDDFAIIVIRLGPLADGVFKSEGFKDEEGRLCYGNTTWSGVIWAEAWPHTTAGEAAKKIRKLRERYNIINMTAKGGYGGIGMDGRGGGRAVADELAQPKPDVLSNGLPDPSWNGEKVTKIYDPKDEKFGHYAAFDDPEKYWSGLRLLTPTNAENWEWTRLTKASMEQHRLYLGYWEAPSTWAASKGIQTSTGNKDVNNEEYHQWLVGYNALKKFKNQLVKLQVAMTSSGLTKVIMSGKHGTEEAKKDLYSAFIYAWQTAREHLVNATKQDQDKEPPNVGPVSVQIARAGNVGSWSNFFQRR